MSAFDALAADYDDAFTRTRIGRYLRARVQGRLLAHFRPGDHVLELGCGTGEDALFLAQRGVRVTATDASRAMLDAAQTKANGHPLLDFALLDLNAPPDALPGSVTYAGVFANFGVLNCVSDRASLAAWLAQNTRPGGVAAFGVMAPFCLWEMTWHSLHGDFKTAFRRLRDDTTFQPEPSAPALPVHYPTVRRLTRDFAGVFARKRVQPLGIALPPSDAFGSVEKRPQLLQSLLRWEQWLGNSNLLANFADHYWIEFQRHSS